MSLTKDDVENFETTKIDIDGRTEFIINKCLKIFFGKEIPHTYKDMEIIPNWTRKGFTKHCFYDIDISAKRALTLNVRDDIFVMQLKYFIFPKRWLWEDFENEVKSIIEKYKKEQKKTDDENKIKNKKNKDIIKAALKKLTPEEKKVLKCRV